MLHRFPAYNNVSKESGQDGGERERHAERKRETDLLLMEVLYPLSRGQLQLEFLDGLVLLPSLFLQLVCPLPGQVQLGGCL